MHKFNKKIMEASDNKNLVKNSLKDIRSNYILGKIFYHLKEIKMLKILRFTKNLQKRLNIGLNIYKKIYEDIEIEIIPICFSEKNEFIHIPDEYQSYYQIYFNDNKEEIKRKYFSKNDKPSKIKVIINKEIKSFEGLFYWCDCIEKISFIRFYRKDINNMKEMFCGCTNLKEIKFYKFCTDNVSDMSYMFFKCTSLTKLNIKNFNVNKVTNMEYMFGQCSSLKEINLDNFDTANVIYKDGIFDGFSNELKIKIAKRYKNIFINIQELY